jgi:hypothetical protein
MYLAVLIKEEIWKDNNTQPAFFVSSLLAISYVALPNNNSSFSGFFRVLCFDSSVFI